MSTMKSKWRRIACSVILALFTGSVIAGTVCTSQSPPHSARVPGWLAVGSDPADAANVNQPGHGLAAGEGPAARTAALSVHGASSEPGHSDASSSCEPPVYTGSKAISDVAKRIDDAAHPTLDAMASQAVGLVWSASANTLPARPSPVPPSARPPDVLALFSRLLI
ncbi:hypothetical protein [Piscinibacter sp.]|uniref:hypothetical protein n=1 Tax=Piscinibacter sp. TaxID=1903157 RepID=UPI002B960C2E|nr:hypothetical protein [Albitalea sp.]HUG24499.1 hypothetical protein [Albitalea sp.]